MSETVVELKGVALQYDIDADPPGPSVLRGIDLRIEAGESLAIVGPSGCGKSSLLNVIGGLLAPTAGSVQIGGVDIATLANDETARLRNERVGFIFQSHHLLPQCTALENVLVPTLVHPDADHRAGAQERARSLLGAVGLSERFDHRPAKLSGGECQRVAVARALINRPTILLADEPTGSLDTAASDDLGDLLTSLVTRENVALVVVTHSERLSARMGRALVLADGALVGATAR